MVSIPTQSKLMNKYPFLDGYNDIKTCRNAHQAASDVVIKTTAFAEMCFLEEKGSNSHHSTSLLYHNDSWPPLSEFNIFTALPMIDAFMKHKYRWLSNWPHSTRHLKEIIVSKHLSFHIFEICYGAARISYPVAQATFSVYFVFEINGLVDKRSDCIVKYFLEGSDEELIPYVNDKLSLSQVKALLKKKLALSSTINLGTTIQVPEDSIKTLIHMKKQMLKEFRFGATTTASHETIPFPYTAHIQISEKCELHGKNCPLFCVKKHSCCIPDEESGNWTPSYETLSSESSYEESVYESHEQLEIPKDTSLQAKRRSRALSVVRGLNSAHYYYDFDDDDDDDVVDKKTDVELSLDYFSYDDDDDDDNNDVSSRV